VWQQQNILLEAVFTIGSDLRLHSKHELDKSVASHQGHKKIQNQKTTGAYIEDLASAVVRSSSEKQSAQNSHSIMIISTTFF
jgi:hypothetical protein